jgi:hypothetical protein
VAALSDSARGREISNNRACELTEYSTAFADLVIGDHRETWSVRSKRFRAWLRQQYYRGPIMRRAQLP